MLWAFVACYRDNFTFSVWFYDLSFVLTVPDEVGSLQFDDVSDRAVKVIWSEPKQINGVLRGYQLTYMVKDQPETLKVENLTPDTLNIMVNHLQVRSWIHNTGHIVSGIFLANQLQTVESSLILVQPILYSWSSETSHTRWPHIELTEWIISKKHILKKLAQTNCANFSYILLVLTILILEMYLIVCGWP
jgi:hypothetical protein